MVGTILALAGLLLGGVIFVVSFIALTLGGVVFLLCVVLNSIYSAFDIAALKLTRKPSGRPKSNGLASTDVSDGNGNGNDGNAVTSDRDEMMDGRSLECSCTVSEGTRTLCNNSLNMSPGRRTDRQANASPVTNKSRTPATSRSGTPASSRSGTPASSKSGSPINSKNSSPVTSKNGTPIKRTPVTSKNGSPSRSAGTPSPTGTSSSSFDMVEYEHTKEI